MNKPIESRADFEKMADDRLADAKSLLDAGRWNAAYYLAGYAVELALKACIIKVLMETDAFPKRKFSERCYTHSIKQLVELAQLEAERQLATDTNQNLLTNWALVQEWTEETRYCRVDRAEAELLYAAIADETDGVLAWIKQYY